MLFELKLVFFFSLNLHNTASCAFHTVLLVNSKTSPIYNHPVFLKRPINPYCTDSVKFSPVSSQNKSLSNVGIISKTSSHHLQKNTEKQLGHLILGRLSIRTPSHPLCMERDPPNPSFLKPFRSTFRKRCFFYSPPSQSNGSEMSKIFYFTGVLLCRAKVLSFYISVFIRETRIMRMSKLKRFVVGVLQLKYDFPRLV